MAALRFDAAENGSSARALTMTAAANLIRATVNNRYSISAACVRTVAGLRSGDLFTAVTGEEGKSGLEALLARRR